MSSYWDLVPHFIPPKLFPSRKLRADVSVAMPPAYSDQPIFHLRIACLISAVCGVILSVLAVSAQYYMWRSGPFITETIAELFSGLLCAWDLLSYKIKKITDPEREPIWPLKKFMYADMVCAVLFQWLFWPVLASIGYGYDDYGALEAYAALMLFVSSILHFFCFWKELLARKKAQWLLTLPVLPCHICGCASKDIPEVQQRFGADGIEDIRPRFYRYTPEDTSNESEILIGRNFDSSYGAIGSAPVFAHTKS